MTLDELKDSWNWAEAFGEGSGGNCDATVEAAVPGDDISLDLVRRADVVRIVASIDGENEGPDWAGIFELADGRFAAVEAGCDYTGWDCQADNRIAVARTEEAAVRYGLGDDNRRRLFGEKFQ
jgi:hypothetical protein